MNANHITRDFSILFLVMLVIGAGNTALQSVLPLIGRSIGVPDFAVALAFSVSAGAWVVAAPYWAARSDRQGRRKMVLLGLTGFTLSVILCGFALSAGIIGLIGGVATMLAFVAARMIYGVFGAAAPPAAQAMVALRTSREARTKALTLLGSAFGLGTILGPALAPFFILPLVGLAGPAYMFGLLGVLVLGMAWRFLPVDDGTAGGKGAVSSYPSIGGAPAGASITAAVSETSGKILRLRDPRIWPWMLTGLIMGHAQAMTGQVMGFLVIDRLGLPIMGSQQAIGIVLMTGACAALLVQWGLIPILGLKPRAMIFVGLIIASLGCVAVANASSLYGIAMAYGLSSIGFGFTRPGFTAGSSLAVGNDMQGAVAGRVTSVNGAAFVLGPSIGVGLYELWHPLPFVVAAMILALLILYVSNKLEA